MKNFREKVTVITGAGSGIGRALAMKFKEEGAKLALNDFNKEALLETVELLGDNQIFYDIFDVSDRSAVFRFSEKVIEYFGTVDVVINNAGVALNTDSFETIDLDKFERVMDVNFKGVLYGCRAFVPHLLNRPSAVLVNISTFF